MYQLGRYIDWPTKVFADRKSPFVIGLLEKDPLIADLEEIARTKSIQDRPIQIRQFPSADAIRPCHILYLSASLSPEAQTEVVRKMTGQPVLLIGDSPDFIKLGGTMQFVVEENTVRLAISRKAAERAGLTVSGRLLQLARVVD